MTRYLFLGILIFVGAVAALRFINSIPLWGWFLGIAALIGVYFYMRKKRRL